MMMKTSTGSNNVANYTQVSKKNKSKATNLKQIITSSNSSQESEGLNNFSQLRGSSASRERIIFDNNNETLKLQFIDQLEQDLDDQNNQVSSLSQHEQVLEEVYICNCCGISKELNPTIKFMSTYKCVFFLFNFLVFAFGLANFGMGLWFRIDPKVYEIHKYIETQNFTYAGWLLLFCGFSACLISLVGFIGAARQAIALLIFYFTITILLTIAFIGTLTLLTVYGLGSTLEQFMTKEIYEQIRRRTMTTTALDSYQAIDSAQFMDFIQVKMLCCGATDYRDYYKLGLTIPTTCYTIDKNYLNAPGCGHAIRQLLDLRAGLATGFTLGSLIAQLLTIISSALMFCSIYHYRAIPRPTHIAMTPQPRNSFSPDIINHSPVIYQDQPRHSLSVQNNKLHLQRPRSRTPIVI